MIWILAVIALVIPPLAFAETPIHLDHEGETWATDTLHKMTIEEKIGQLIMPWARVEFMNVNSPGYLLLRDEMQRFHVGGFGVTVFTDGPALLKSGPLEAAALTNGLQRDSKYPLLFAADFERGLSMRLNGATPFPTAMAFGAAADKDLVRKFGSISAREARAIGVQWNWFPVADVNSNPANPIINTRSFGEDPTQVGELVSAYIAGAHSEGLLTTVKHFPGHGDTDTDSHLALARVTASRDRLDHLELVPFRAAIAAGVDSVMTAHVTVPAIEPDPNRPASISSNVITGLLKQKLGFQGLVVTDALDMGALMSVFTGTPAQISGQEAVQAIQAGNDMVIIPADLEGAYNGLLNAVQQGTLSTQRIDASVLKILRLKASVGLNRQRFVDPEAVARDLGRPEDAKIGQTVSDRAITLVSDQNKLLPLRLASNPKPSLAAILFTDDARSSEGLRSFSQLLRQRVPDATILVVDEANAPFLASQVAAAVSSATTVITVAEVVPRARRATHNAAAGSSSLDQDTSSLLASIIKTAGNKTIFAAFGSPYVGVGIPDIGTYICTFSNSPASASSLLSALFGEIPIHGHSPVSIPGIANRGTGIDRAAISPIQPTP
jgi:beta-N-acetylhexosaminidase